MASLLYIVLQCFIGITHFQKGESIRDEQRSERLTARVKTMLILFFDSKGVIHHEYVLRGQTKNATFYV